MRIKNTHPSQLQSCESFLRLISFVSALLQSCNGNTVEWWIRTFNGDSLNDHFSVTCTVEGMIPCLKNLSRTFITHHLIPL